MRRNLAAQMGRHRLRKQSCQYNCREKQQPTSNSPEQKRLEMLNKLPKTMATESSPDQTCESTTSEASSASNADAYQTSLAIQDR